MEYLLLIIAVPLVWFLLLPLRVVGRVRRFPVTSAGIVAATIIVGWMAANALQTREPGPAGSYERGDVALRAMLE